jgi:hypothetical protein
MTLLTRQEDISDEIETRLGRITVALGAETNIGARVLLGRRHIDDDKVPCVVIVEGIDSAILHDGKRRATSETKKRYVLVGYDKCEADHPNRKGHAIVRDLKRAIFRDGRTLGDQVKEVQYIGSDIGPRKDGVGIVMATVEISVEFLEDLANP